MIAHYFIVLCGTYMVALIVTLQWFVVFQYYFTVWRLHIYICTDFAVQIYVEIIQFGVAHMCRAPEKFNPFIPQLKKVCILVDNLWLKNL